MNRRAPDMERHTMMVPRERLAENDVRFLGMSFRRLRSFDRGVEALERNLTFFGMLGNIDPARPEAGNAVGGNYVIATRACRRSWRPARRRSPRPPAFRITGKPRVLAPPDAGGCWRVDNGTGGGRVTVGSGQDPGDCHQVAAAPTTTKGALAA